MPVFVAEFSFVGGGGGLTGAMAMVRAKPKSRVSTMTFFLCFVSGWSVLLPLRKSSVLQLWQQGLQDMPEQPLAPVQHSHWSLQTLPVALHKEQE